MIHDTELDRMREQQEVAFTRKQTLYHASQEAWRKRSQARDILNEEYEKKQEAVRAKERARKHYQRVRKFNDRLIERLAVLQTGVFERMNHTFDSAEDTRSGFESTDSTSTTQEHILQEIAREYGVESQRLVDEIRKAYDKYQASKLILAQAREEFKAAQASFEVVKAEHIREETAFKAAQQEHARITADYRARLKKAKEGNETL